MPPRTITAAFAIHRFFQDKNFIYVHSPEITCSDCEGAGEMFQVTTLDLDNLPRDAEGNIDYSKARVARIRDTLSLNEFEVSEALAEELRGAEGVEILSEPYELYFDKDGYLEDFE